MCQVAAHPPFLWCDMISIFLTPYQRPEVFEAQHRAIARTIGVGHEFLCTLLTGDPLLEWYREYTAQNGIRAMMVPNLGVVNLVNMLAARAVGTHMLYIPDIVDVIEEREGWGKRALNALPHKDNIGGAVLSLVHNDQNSTGLLMPVRTFHVLGYYSCPIFDTPVYGYRWAASVLTELGRLVNIRCGFRYAPLPEGDEITRDRELFNVTRQGRVAAAERLMGFMEAEDDERDTAHNG